MWWRWPWCTDGGREHLHLLCRHSPSPPVQVFAMLSFALHASTDEIQPHFMRLLRIKEFRPRQVCG
jgi:hypothetical protein